MSGARGICSLPSSGLVTPIPEAPASAVVGYSHQTVIDSAKQYETATCVSELCLPRFQYRDPGSTARLRPRDTTHRLLWRYDGRRGHTCYRIRKIRSRRRKSSRRVHALSRNENHSSPVQKSNSWLTDLGFI